MNRQEHEYELAASHARGEAEDRHNERMRLFREIDEGMKEILDHKHKDNDHEPF